MPPGILRFPPQLSCISLGPNPIFCFQTRLYAKVLLRKKKIKEVKEIDVSGVGKTHSHANRAHFEFLVANLWQSSTSLKYTHTPVPSLQYNFLSFVLKSLTPLPHPYLSYWPCSFFTLLRNWRNQEKTFLLPFYPIPYQQLRHIHCLLSRYPRWTFHAPCIQITRSCPFSPTQGHPS